jgi:hypothetical protein
MKKIIKCKPGRPINLKLTVGRLIGYGGAEGIRTPDLLLAKQALSRLSYSPNVHYCIKYCVAAKALSFLVHGIAVILRKRIHKWI